MSSPTSTSGSAAPQRSLRAGLERRIRAAWWRVRPFQLPRYPASTPWVGRGGPLDFRLAPTADTVGAAAMSEEAADAAEAILAELSPDQSIDASRFMYSLARAKFGTFWRCADLVRTLWAAATFLQPTTYLEVGVWRGRGVAIVGTVSPTCAIYGFDMWIPDYAGSENPGPEFVKEELKSVGHTGKVVLVSGDSRETLPAFLRQHPDLYFDLITIDGDKSMSGAASDFAAALPRLKVGGIVVYDDMAGLPRLRRIWNNVIKSNIRYVYWEFRNGDRGVAAAVRISE